MRARKNESKFPEKPETGHDHLNNISHTKEWLLKNPLRSAGTLALAIFLFILTFSASKEASKALSNENIEAKVMDSIAEPSTMVRASGGIQRAEVLEETAKLQGFSNTYPTYELAEEDVSGGTLSEEESTAIVDKVDKVVEEEIQEEEQSKLDASKTTIRYVDQKAYDAAPYIKVAPVKPMRNIWWALKPYESYYEKYPIKWYVPRLDPSINLTPELFHEHFRRHVPVIINSESLRHLGFRSRAWSFEELRKAFPFNETKAFNIVKDYKANAIRNVDEEIDLGPGVASIVRDEKLAKQGNLRNYPRNLHVKREALAKLEIDYPPLIEGGTTTWQLPTLWLGTSTADTPFHHDCCDNFVFMVAGIKRFTLAPPSDWRLLSPNCSGPNKSLCWAKVSDPNKADLPKKSKDIVDAIHKIVIELRAGEMLYMPAGWFHHVKNLGPTVMVNFWTRNQQIIGLVKVLKEAA